MWNEIDVTDEPLYDFDPNSTYIQNPTFFQGLSKEPGKIEPLKSLRVMGKFDSVTTDHISPAGAIGKDTPAGKYLLDHDVAIRNFNSYGSVAVTTKLWYVVHLPIFVSKPTCSRY